MAVKKMTAGRKHALEYIGKETRTRAEIRNQAGAWPKRRTKLEMAAAAKKTPLPIKPKKVVLSSLDKFLTLLAGLYPFDRLAPGLVMAYLPERECFYVSVVRYDDSNGDVKQVLVKALGFTTTEATTYLMECWTSPKKLEAHLQAGRVVKGGQNFRA